MTNIITLHKDHDYFISPMIRNSLGNNLFQIAAICSYAYDMKVKYVVEDIEYTGSHKSFNDKKLCELFPNLHCVNGHKYYWDLYDCEYKKDNSENIYHINTYVKKQLRTKLIGSFISYKYFDHNRNYILKLFDFHNDIKKNILKKYNDIFNNYVTVSVHIRRGDYIKKLHLKIWCLLGKDYYMKAFDKFNDIDNIMFLFFYEDNESKLWIIKNLVPHVNNYKLISNLAFEDIFLMSHCNHNIIANSTFSYWGAYLNNNDNRIIITPSKWKYTDTNNNINRICPSSWIKIDSECNMSIN